MTDRPASIAAVLVATLVVTGVVVAVHLGARPEAPAGGEARPKSARHVIVIDLPGLRPDRMSLYGASRPTTPALAALADRAMVFDAAYSSAVTTLPATASLHTGLRPRAHGLLHPVNTLSDSYVTLAERLRQNGFSTAAFVDGVHVDRRFGLAQGFDEYDARGTRDGGLAKHGPRLLAWIESHASTPLFAYVQSTDVTAPYRFGDDAALGDEPAAPDDAERLRKLNGLDVHRRFARARYPTFGALLEAHDRAVRAADRRLGELVEQLDAIGVLEDALLIVTAPHGTSLLDHGLYAGHGLSLFEEEARIPLLVKLPSGQHGGVRRADVVRRIDVLSTIARWTGVRSPAEAQGVDLTPADAGPRVAYGTAPNLYRAGDPTADGRTSFVRAGQWKLLQPPRLPLDTLVHHHLHHVKGAPYDLERDPLGVRAAVAETAVMFDVRADPGEVRSAPLDETAVAPELLEHLARIEAEDDQVRATHVAADRDDDVNQ